LKQNNLLNALTKFLHLRQISQAGEVVDSLEVVVCPQTGWKRQALLHKQMSESSLMLAQIYPK
jgi:hypothetical protein